MAIYTSEAALRARMGTRAFLQYLSDSGNVNTDAVADVCTRADHLIEAYAVRQYPRDVLRASGSPILSDIGTAVAAHYACERKPELTDPDKGTAFQAPYDGALKMLREIGAGTLSLGLETTAGLPPNTTATIRAFLGQPVAPGMFNGGTGFGGY